MKPPYLYILEGHEIVACPDREKWSYWMFGADEKETRRVALDEVDGFEVSTVFIGIDNGFGYTDRPILFETMVFNAAGKSVSQRRYCTWDEAEAGHREVCAELKAKQATPRQ